MPEGRERVRREEGAKLDGEGDLRKEGVAGGEAKK